MQEITGRWKRIWISHIILVSKDKVAKNETGGLGNESKDRISFGVAPQTGANSNVEHRGGNDCEQRG